jgi:RNA polymerase sigma factor (sigma-70 family)
LKIFNIFFYIRFELQEKQRYTEPELILLLKAKDRRAYSYLYDNYGAALYSIVVKVLGEREESLDVLQDAFVKIWKNIEDYDATKGRLFTWMLQITRNTAIDFTRSGVVKKEKLTNRLSTESPIVEHKKFSYIPVDHLGLAQVIEGLGNDDKLIVDLAYFKGYTQQEIAKKLAIPLGTVKTRARNALIKLKKILKTS